MVAKDRREAESVMSRLALGLGGGSIAPLREGRGTARGQRRRDSATPTIEACCIGASSKGGRGCRSEEAGRGGMAFVLAASRTVSRTAPHTSPSRRRSRWCRPRQRGGVLELYCLDGIERQPAIAVGSCLMFCLLIASSAPMAREMALCALCAASLSGGGGYVLGRSYVKPRRLTQSRSSVPGRRLLDLKEWTVDPPSPGSDLDHAFDFSRREWD